MFVTVNAEEVNLISNWRIVPHSFITQDETPLQQIGIVFGSKIPETQLTLQVFHGETKITENILKNITAGTNTLLTFVPEPNETIQCT
jgi:hypothetical protein